MEPMWPLIPNEKDKPILQFFRRLIVNNSSQNTVLTNSQLEEILRKEFDFDLPKLHALEVDIYMCVLKKFLKDWPQWDEFDSTMKLLIANGDQKELGTLLDTGYKNLKDFLKVHLDITRPLAEESVMKLTNECNDKSQLPQAEASSSEEGVVLEIQATRDQLNKLIYRCPHPSYNNTIFNAGDRAAPSHISLNTLSLEAILNWWSIRIQVNLQWDPQVVCMYLKRETCHELEHSLINLKTKRAASPVVWLNEEIQTKNNHKAAMVSKDQIIWSLDQLSMSHAASVDGMATIIQYLKKDLDELPFCVSPGHYKRYLSKHPYVRYLSTESSFAKKSDKSKYDMQLKEKISPLHEFQVGRMEGKLDSVLPPQWLKVECISCNATFADTNLGNDLKQHFNEYHQIEPDWQCTNCQKTFTMAHLAEKWWNHECEFVFNKKNCD